VWGITTTTPFPEEQGPGLVFNEGDLGGSGSEKSPLSENGRPLGSLPGHQTAAQFEKSLVGLPPGERVAQIKAAASAIVVANGMVKDNKISRINGRDVYKASDGNLYALDTQHGRFEIVDSKRGVHLGEVDFDFKKVKSADGSGGHDLKVK